MKCNKILLFCLTGCIAIPLSSACSASNGKTKNHKNKATVATATTTPAVPAPKALTGYLTFTTNYMLRGITFSGNLPAVQGSLTYTFLPTGIYFNLWGSNADFDDAQGKRATLELDTVIGVTNTIGKQFTYNVFLIRYNYPKTNASFLEFNAGASYYFITALYAYSGNEFGTHTNGTYYNLGFKCDVPPKYFFNLTNINVSGGIGHYNLSRSGGLKDYNDYNLQINKTINNYTLTLEWTDTDGRSVDPAQNRDSHIVAMLTVNF